VNGRLGPWKTDNPGQTPLSGSYTFQQARLGVFQAIAGTLDSQGRFSGVVEHLEVEGSTDTPDFQANQTSHLVHLKTHFQAVVNATNGDTFLQPVEGYFERTKITARGEVAGKRGGGRRKGKTASLHMMGEGLIENLFRLLVRSEPPIKGNVNFSTQVQVPPGDLQFLKKIYLEGDFQIAEATFVNPARQSDVRRLSIRARGLKNRGSETIESSLKGHVTLRNAVANFSGFSISIPGASALLSGTYNLLNERINLHGTLRMDSSISHATTGLKSVLLKVLNPVLKKKRSAGSVLPVRITGTYRQPSFGLAVASGQ
jgi:AsmA-like C-terminal region